MRRYPSSSYFIFVSCLFVAPVACVDESCTRTATCVHPDAGEPATPAANRSDSGLPSPVGSAAPEPEPDGDSPPEGDQGPPAPMPDSGPRPEDTEPDAFVLEEDGGFLNIADPEDAMDLPPLDAGGSAESEVQPDSGASEERAEDAGACADGGCDIEPSACVDGPDSDCCEPGATRSCAEVGALGACSGGTQLCDEKGEWSACSIAPALNDACWLGADDNCDGVANSPLDPACACVEGDVECDSAAPTPGFHVCSVAGTWAETLACPYVCSEGQCTGECVPGTRVCEGDAPRACDGLGVWNTEPACPAPAPCQGSGECLECPDGTFASGGACLPFRQCAPGEYVSSEGTSTADRVCSACPAGAYSLEANAAVCETWTTCSPGTFVQSAGTATSDRSCGPCAPGTFSATENVSSCVACGPDSFAPDPFATTCQPWTSCVAGTYILTQGTATADRQCVDCAPGTYSVGSNRGKCTAWSECDPGDMTDELGTPIADRTCKPIESCVDLDTTCGPDESCCTSLLVSGGSFIQNNTGDVVTTISDVRIDKYEVTVGRFRKFFEDWQEGYRPAAGSGKHTHLNNGNGLRTASGNPEYEGGWDVDWVQDTNLTDASLTLDGPLSTWTPMVGYWEDQPINTVTWAEGYAFCIWDGGFLPSSAELNYAAAGGAEQRYYPWSVPPASIAISSAYANYQCMGDGQQGCTKGDSLAVGSRPAGAGRYGHMDLAGSVAEWVRDTTIPAICTDCVGLSAVDTAWRRGGSFLSASLALRTQDRQGSPVDVRDAEYGIRCARIP